MKENTMTRSGEGSHSIITYVNPVTKDLCLYSVNILNAQASVPVRKKTNHVIIFDRSGSMTWLLPEVCDDLIKMLDIMYPGDTLTLGWFSSEGQYNWIVKGMEVSANKDAIRDAINKHRHSVSLTCFSDILTDTAEHVIDDLSTFGGSFSLTFMTDGYPVVSNTEREVNKVMDALKKISGKIASVLFIGYGDYYNRDLMAKMAQQCGGVLVHASHLVDFEIPTFKHVTGDAPEKRIPIALPKIPYLSVFTVSDSISTVPVSDDWTAMVPDGSAWVYALAKSEYKLPEFPQSENYSQAAYAAAAMEVKSGRTDVAMDILGALGDVRLIKLLSNSWTNAEYGRTQFAIENAAIVESNRYIEGYNVSFVPDPNAFCLMNALDLLINDSNAYFYPRHPAFQYKRTGVATVVRDGYPKFETDQLTRSPFNGLTWNSKRLNLSVRALIPGTVDLGPEAASHGLMQMFGEAHIWRNYIIVKDGILHTTTIPASMSKEVFDVLYKNGMIVGSRSWSEGEIFPVRLDTVPIVNKVLATPTTSKEYCNMLTLEQDLEYAQKYLKWELDRVDPDKTVSKSIEYSADQIEFLATKGINDKGIYDPPSDKSEATDYYFATEFDVKIKGYSSMPKLEDLVAKHEKSSTSFTPTEEKMNGIIVRYKASKPAGIDENSVEYAMWLRSTLDVVKKNLANVRGDIQSKRFAILLCKKSFTDIPKMDGAEVELDGKKFTFVVRQVQEKY